MALLRRAGRLARDLLALVFPARCCCCDVPMVAGDGPLCQCCAGEVLELTRGDYCRRCGQDVGPYGLRPSHVRGREGLPVCGLCEKHALRYAALARVGPYEQPLSRLIKALKYGGGTHLAQALGRWQGARLSAEPWFAGLDALVPVPLHWRRRFGRGFNQSELLAEFIAREHKLKLAYPLTRPVHRPPQASLPRTRRIENVRGVFAVPDRSRASGLTFCLIDDVCTTGATLSEAARTLLEAGAGGVYACVVATARPPAPFNALWGVQH